LPGHRGVDIEAAEGSLVHAATGGVVWFAGIVASRPLVSIAHPNGTRTTYEPVRPLVSPGDAVAAGDVIGALLAGHAGCENACLHWGLRQGDIYLDPLSLFGLARIRLLPPSASAGAS
jgi:murein DD-endopeptidase MepM/ murein hydrolase activator NlpD